MIIMHDFGNGEVFTQIYYALLDDGTYAVRWNPGDDYTIFLDEATLKAKALEAEKKAVQLDVATFQQESPFEFTEDELGIAVDM